MVGKALRKDGLVRLVFIVSLLILTQCYYTSHAQNHVAVITVKEEKISYETLFGMIEKETGYRVHYPPRFNVKALVYCKKGVYSWKELLGTCLPADKFGYNVKGNTIWIRAVKPLTMVILLNSRQQAAANVDIEALGSPRVYTTDGRGVALIHRGGANQLLAFPDRNGNPDTLALPAGDTVVLQLPFRDVLETAIYTGYVNTTKRNYTGDRGVVEEKDFEQTTVSNPLEVLSGRMAGVTVTQTSGVNGAAVAISVRGRNSILNGQDPFYIIDGIPYAPKNKSVSYIASGNSAGSLSPFSWLSPDMIERMEVLKDADATAIYGSRGANGVIIITTKQGKEGRFNIDVHLSEGMEQATRRPELMNTREFAAMRNEALANDHLSADVSHAPDLVLWGTTNSTDWGKKLIGGAASTTHLQLSASGGNARLHYLVNYSKLLEKDVFPGKPQHDLNSFNSSFVYHSKDEKLRVQASAIAGFDYNHQFITDITQYQLLVPNAPPLLKNNKVVFSAAGLSMNNPLSYAEQPYQAKSHNVLIGGNAGYVLLPHLLLTTTLGYHHLDVNEYSAVPASSQDPSKTLNGQVYTADNVFQSWIAEPQLSYDLKRGSWTIDALAGSTWQGDRMAINTSGARGLTWDPTPANPILASLVEKAGDTVDYIYKALFARFNFRWKDRYVLNLTARQDISSQFSRGKRRGDFGAAGAAWIFSDEGFFKKALPFVNMGKLRGSYGVTGNDQISGTSDYFSNWTPTVIGPYQSQPSTLPLAKLDPEVSWETIKKLELGMDLGLWANRLLFSASWYRNRSGNQLVPDGLPNINAVVVLQNKPIIVENSGWEFTLSSHNIQTKKFSWTSSFNLGLFRNKLVAFPDLEQSATFRRRLMVGQSLSALRAYQYTGVDPLTGLFTFKQKSATGLSNDDFQMIGKLDPRCTGGLENVFNLGPWQLSLFVEGRIQQGANYQTSIYFNNLPGSNMSWPYTNETKALLNRWRKPGDKAAYQKLSTSDNDVYSAAQNWIGSSAMLTNTSFLRLKTMQISYRLPALSLHKLGLQDLRLSLEGQNLFTLTPCRDVDPEVPSILVLPPMRGIQMSIQARF